MYCDRNMLTLHGERWVETQSIWISHVPISKRLHSGLRRSHCSYRQVAFARSSSQDETVDLSASSLTIQDCSAPAMKFDRGAQN
jgi:hypothetical protein